MARITRRTFLQHSMATAGTLAAARGAQAQADAAPRPNILLAIADDWSCPHAGAYGTRGVHTPAFDRVAREGCLFTNGFTAAPQCSPNRAALLTGRPIWQLEEAGTHASLFPTKFTVYPDVLEAAGYRTGFTCKGWGPGDWQRSGWPHNPAGPEYSGLTLDAVPADGIKNIDYAANFAAFLDERRNGEPFCFLYGASEPHRRYEPGSGLRAGKRLEDAVVPSFLPDTEEIRSDILDYYLEIEWFDRHLGRMLELLEARGELDNTLVVVTGDNGMPFPGAKATVQEYGTHVPLALRWGRRALGGRVVDDLISHIDLAPTFLEAAGLDGVPAMRGRSFLGLLTGDTPYTPRDAVYTGRERHTHARYDNQGYPARAVRTRDYLYIRNFKPERWPMGDPPEYHDIDACPSKTFLMERREAYPEHFAHCFGMRTAEELYDIRRDPGCRVNLAGDPAHLATRNALSTQLMHVLTAEGDPRALGTGDIFDSYPRVSGMRPELGGFAEQGAYNPRYALE